MNQKPALIMCIFDRIENLPLTLNCIQNQTYTDFDFFIINNSDKDNDYIKNITSKYNILNIKVEKFGNDKSPFSRISFAKYLSEQGYETFIILDDDEIIKEDFVKQCVDQCEFGHYKAWWSYKIKDSYFNRDPLLVGEYGNYGGVGGCTFKKDIFSIDNIMDCPDKYKYFDDIWISSVINKSHFKISKLDVDIKFIEEKVDKSLYGKLKDKKNSVWKELNL